MAAPRVYSDEAINEAWEATGSIRETARRVGANYNTIYEHLRLRNKIVAPVFSTGDSQHHPRTIPDNITLVIPDMQAPAQHPDALPFLCAVRDKYQPVNIVCIGDELDLNWLSEFAKLPEADQPHSEFAAAQGFLRSFFAEFPKAVACTSNHVHGRFDKARTRGRIPSAFLKPIDDIIDAPVGWSWHSQITMGDILFRHGHRDILNLKRLIQEEIPAETGRHYSIILGHFHTRFGQATPDIKVGDKLYYGAFTGCLINPKHPFFGYSRGYERLGCLMVVHGRVVPIPMALNEHGRWTGKL